MSQKLLTFEYDSAGEVVTLHLNREGLEYLIGVLVRMRDLAAPDHVHLMTADWGGEELTDQKQASGSVLIHHVKLCKW